MKKFGKICAGLLIGGIVAGGGLLVGCNSTNTNDDGMSKTSDVYGFAGAVTSMLASETGVSSAMVSAQDTQSPLADIKKSISTAVTETLDKYMDIFDTLVGGQKPVKTSVEDVTAEDTEGVGYAHKMTIKANTIAGDEHAFVLYFNETLTDQKTDVDDIDDEERTTLLVGKLVLENGQVMYVKGEKEVEDDEFEITFKASFDAKDFSTRIEFSQEHEPDEQEYEFKVYVGGHEVTSFSFELEKNKKGELELEYEYEMAGVTVTEFKIKKSSNNEILVTAEDFFGFKDIEIKVTAEKNDGVVTYKYSIPKLDLILEGLTEQFK